MAKDESHYLGEVMCVYRARVDLKQVLDRATAWQNGSADDDAKLVCRLD